MAIKGLSKLVVGKYAYDESVVTYTNPQVVQKMVEYSLTLNQSENNPLYADNAEAENDKGTFQNGELSITTDDLTQEVSVMILGTKENDEVTYEQSKKVKEQVYDDTMNPPDLGVGFIELHQNKGVDKYRAIFLHKVFFNVPEQAATTKGEQVEWQTPTITGTVQRSEGSDANGKHPWMTDAWFDSEEDALSYLLFKCGKAVSELRLKKVSENK